MQFLDHVAKALASHQLRREQKEDGWWGYTPCRCLGLTCLTEARRDLPGPWAVAVGGGDGRKVLAQHPQPHLPWPSCRECTGEGMQVHFVS